MFEVLMYLKDVFKSMTLPKGCPVLTNLEGWVLEVGEEVLRPLMLVMVTLEGQST